MTQPLKRTGFMQGIHQISSTKKEVLGSMRITRDGRKFRYAKAGASALAAGKMGIMAACTANHVNCSVAVAAAVGDRQIQLTLGATAATADQYLDGYLMVNDAAGEGHNLLIDTNAAAASAGTCVVTLKEALPYALTTSSQATLVPNPWNGVTESTTEESGAAGIPQVAVTAAYYYWAQTAGVANALASGTGAVGSLLTLGATAGSLIVISTTIATTVTQPIVGHLFGTVQVDTEYKPVFLTLD